MEIGPASQSVPTDELSENQLAHITGGADLTHEEVRGIFDRVYQQSRDYTTEQVGDKGVSVLARGLGSIPKTAAFFSALTGGTIAGEQLTKKKGS